MDKPTPDWTPPPDPDDPRTPFQRFEDFTRRLVAVPKEEIDEQRAKEQAAKEQGESGG